VYGRNSYVFINRSMSCALPLDLTSQLSASSIPRERTTFSQLGVFPHRVIRGGSVFNAGEERDSGRRTMGPSLTSGAQKIAQAPGQRERTVNPLADAFVGSTSMLVSRLSEMAMAFRGSPYT
jgi:hypothetical protein